MAKVMTFDEFRELWQNGEERLRGDAEAEEMLGRGVGNRMGWVEWPDGTRMQLEEAR